MLRFNENKVFVDSLDDQLVALVIESGAYYTFGQAATAVVNDFAAGYEVSEVEAALVALAGEDASRKLADFVQGVVAAGVMEECQGEVPTDRPAMQCAGLQLAGELFLDMDGYDDVAAYFMVDPIHEVDPDMGWPALPQE